MEFKVKESKGHLNLRGAAFRLLSVAMQIHVEAAPEGRAPQIRPCRAKRRLDLRGAN